MEVELHKLSVEELVERQARLQRQVEADEELIERQEADTDRLRQHRDKAHRARVETTAEIEIRKLKGET